MFADAYHAFASHFASRLNPLQFNRGHSVEDRVSALERGRRAQSAPAAASQNLHTEGPSAAPQSSSWAQQMGQRLAEKHDRVEEADHARVMQRSGDLLQSIRNTAAAHRAAAPLPEERHEDLMSRSGALLDSIRQSQARSDAAHPVEPSAPAPAPSTSGRTLRAPAPTTAPMHSASGVGKGVQRGLFSPKEAGPRVKAVRKPVETPVEPGPGKGQLSLWSDKPAATPKAAAPRAKRAADKPSAAAPKSPSGSPAPKVSGAELDAMVDSWTSKRPAKSKAAAPAPAASSSSASNVRETTLKVNGKEQVVRTTHNGSQQRLDAKHTLAVKAALAEIRAPKVQEAQARLDSARSNGAKKSTITGHEKAVRQAANPPTNPAHSPSFNEAYKRPPGTGYDKAAAERVKAFMGDGTDDPNQSHYYGIGKK